MCLFPQCLLTSAPPFLDNLLTLWIAGYGLVSARDVSNCSFPPFFLKWEILSSICCQIMSFFSFYHLSDAGGYRGAQFIWCSSVQRSVVLLCVPGMQLACVRSVWFWRLLLLEIIYLCTIYVSNGISLELRIAVPWTLRWARPQLWKGHHKS